MKICVLSDIHLDHHFDDGLWFLNSLEIPECDITVIAGDLCQINHRLWHSAIKNICSKSNHVIYVLGNHEYFDTGIAQGDKSAKKLQSFYKNLTVCSESATFTNKEVPVLKDLAILGGTLWFPDGPENVHNKRFMSDFFYIKDLEPEIYHRNKQFDSMLHGIKDEPCVVISHHLPSFKSVSPKFAKSSLNRFFIGGEFEDVIQNSKIKCWIHGHSHDSNDFYIGDCRIVSNPFGYLSEVKRDWKPLVIDIS